MPSTQNPVKSKPVTAAQERRKPDLLKGIRVLVGRSKAQAPALSRLLRARGASVTEIPFIEIRAPVSWREFDGALDNLSAYDWLVLTSANGVEAMHGRMRKLKLPLRALAKLKIAAIGPATRAALEGRGVKVSITPREYVAEAVVQSLKPYAHGKRILLVRARVARDVIPRELRKAGAEVDVVAAYETVLPADSRRKLKHLLRDPKRRPQVITFTSSSTVRNFVKLAAGARLDGIRFASIGPVTSATMRELGLPVSVEADEYTMAGLVEAICELKF